MKLLLTPLCNTQVYYTKHYKITIAFILLLSYFNLGMKYISHNIDIPYIPVLTNKSTVTIQAFVSVKDINISVSFNKLQFNTFLKTFSEFCLICAYCYAIKKIKNNYLCILSVFG